MAVPRATQNALANRMRSAGRSLPTPNKHHKNAAWKRTRRLLTCRFFSCPPTPKMGNSYLRQLILLRLTRTPRLQEVKHQTKGKLATIQQDLANVFQALSLLQNCLVAIKINITIVHCFLGRQQECRGAGTRSYVFAHEFIVSICSVMQVSKWVWSYVKNG